MKAWLIRRDVASVKGHLGDVFDTKEAAEWAVYYDKGNHTIVEIEIPDPPHVWKVGDWFDLGGAIRRRIADIVPSGDGVNHGAVVVHWRDAYGRPHCKQEWLSVIQRDATPCDPPEWWEGDR